MGYWNLFASHTKQRQDYDCLRANQTPNLVAWHLHVIMAICSLRPCYASRPDILLQFSFYSGYHDNIERNCHRDSKGMIPSLLDLCRVLFSATVPQWSCRVWSADCRFPSLMTWRVVTCVRSAHLFQYLKPNTRACLKGRWLRLADQVSWASQWLIRRLGISVMNR